MHDNRPEFEALSPEAKVMIGAYWGVMIADKVQFDRPWAIHPTTRKALDELVAAGYLTMEPLNRYKDCPLLWKPTAKLREERPGVSQAFLKEHSTFPVLLSDEEAEKAAPAAWRRARRQELARQAAAG